MNTQRLSTYFHVHLVSDSTGETLNAMTKAVCARFDGVLPIEHMYPLVRSPRQLDRVLKEIAAAPGVAHLAMGGVDLQRDLGTTGGNSQTLYVRSHLVICSRAAGIEPPIDSVFPQLQDDAGLREQAEFARSLGFSGKSAIHPRQLAVLHRVFSPSGQEIAWAREVLAAFDAAGGAALRLPDGEFVDLPVAHRAQRLLELSGKLSAK